MLIFWPPARDGTGKPISIPPRDGQEGKIIISAVERRDGKKILIWRAGSRDGIGKYD